MSTAVILNLKLGEITSKATTYRTNFPFNSFCKLADGTYLGASGSGLYEVGGTTDNGSAISAYFEPVTTDFGLSNPKRMRYLYLTFEAEEGEMLEIVATPDGKTAEAVTVQFVAKKTGKQVGRETVTRSSSGVYWSFLIRNVSGVNFTVSRLEVLPVVLSQGRGN